MSEPPVRYWLQANVVLFQPRKSMMLDGEESLATLYNFPSSTPRQPGSPVPLRPAENLVCLRRSSPDDDSSSDIRGGKVVGAVALTGKQYSRQLRLTENKLAKLREKYGDIEEDFRAITGHGYDALTESEARHILTLQPADTFRDRVAAEGVAGRHEVGKGRIDASGAAVGSSGDPRPPSVPNDGRPRRGRSSRFGRTLLEPR
jgi:hypothetical protein